MTNIISAENQDGTTIDAPVQRKARLIPATADTLGVWRYMEYSVLRIIAGWGRQACDWEDKLAVCYHVWLQAEIVDRLRKRLEMFPPHKPEMPVSKEYEFLSNAALMADDFETAMHGVHGLLNTALANAYRSYLTSSHPVHDKPTHDLLLEVLEFKGLQENWYTDFQKRYSSPSAPAYTRIIQDYLASLNHFVTALPIEGQPAKPAGIDTDFRMPETPGRVPHWNEAPNIMPFLELDWSTSVEARRLFFMIGYCWEMGVAEQQLRWIFYADFMPWEYVYEESRHMWDESRHGNSGLSRLKDFGLDIKDVGYSSYGSKGDGFLAPMTPADVYNAFYAVTQIAERGYFKTKTYCFEDFAVGDDASSAEMMQYDIIDETTHAEYGRKWLTEMAERAGVDEDWLKRGANDREVAQKASDERVASYRAFVEHGDADATVVMPDSGVSVAPSGNHRALLDPVARDHYQHLLAVLREQLPLKNAATAPMRPNLPM